jgi:hypothetical protein
MRLFRQPYDGRLSLISQQDQGKYAEAEEMNRQALAGREKVLGADHPSTLASVYCLARLLTDTQHFHEALSLYERAVEGYRRVLGPRHPTTVACQPHQAALKESDISIGLIHTGIQDADISEGSFPSGVKRAMVVSGRMCQDMSKINLPEFKTCAAIMNCRRSLGKAAGILYYTVRT